MEHWKNISLGDLKEDVDGVIYVEKWKPIIGFDSEYHVSNFGRVKSFYDLSEGRILKQQRCGDGYKSVQLPVNGNSKRFTIHRLVATAFLKNPKNKPYVNHKNGIKHDNRSVNLEWSTCSENHKHAFDTGLRVGAWLNKTGKDNHSSKKVHQIDVATGRIIATYDGASDAARILNIDRRSLCQVAAGKGKTYKGFKWKYA